jgi:hypothetical protein
MGTYSDESPDAGIAEKLRNSVKKIADYVAPDTNNARKIRAQVEQVEGQHDPSTLARMRTSQSSDWNNSYNY